MAGTVQGFRNGTGFSTTTREVLFLVPELLFLAFMAVVAVGSSIGLVASAHSSRERCSCVAGGRSGSGEAHPRRPQLSTLLTAGGVAMLAVPAVRMLLLSLRVVLEAPLAVVIVAAAAAAATVVLAVVASVIAVATALVALWASAVVLARTYGSSDKQAT